MNNKRLLIIVVLVISLKANAQDTITFRQWFERAEYFLFNKQYSQAVKIYEKLLEKDSSNTNICFHLSLCYLNLSNENIKAVYYLKKIFSNSTLGIYNPQNDYYIWLGRLYHINHPEELKTIENSATGFMFDPNKPYSNLAISGNGKTLVFVNSQTSENKIYFITKSGNKWSEATDITSQVGSLGNCFPSSLSYDGSRLYLTKYDNFESDIYVSTFNGKSWSGMHKLNGYVNSLYWDTHACESPDGKFLYFASNRPGGFGGMDLYYSIKMGNDWAKPINAGIQINTFLNDDYPLLTNGGLTLIYSSQGFKKGKDGYDIYYCTSVAENLWSVPINLGYPVNSPEDDLTYVPLTDESQAYFNLSLLNAKNDVTSKKTICVSGQMTSNDTINFNNIIIQEVDNNHGNILSSSRLNPDGKFKEFLMKGDYTFKLFYNDNLFKIINFFIPFVSKEDTANINIKLTKDGVLKTISFNDSSTNPALFANYNSYESYFRDSTGILKKKVLIQTV